NLSSNNLVGTIPSTLGTLSYLEYLDLRLNQLTGTVPATLGSITELSAAASPKSPRASPSGQPVRARRVPRASGASPYVRSCKGYKCI
ncbi:hypothetical protein CLOM_g19222, partial [Closterium sp. NIES-68]